MSPLERRRLTRPAAETIVAVARSSEARYSTPWEDSGKLPETSQALVDSSLEPAHHEIAVAYRRPRARPEMDELIGFPREALKEIER
jgi:hypothetical protein